MALISCRECGKEVSEQAPKCPHCGYPLKPTSGNDDAPLRSGSYIPEKRSFIGVFFLSIITLSIYFWVYLFRSVRDIENTIQIHRGGATPDGARTGLTWALLLSIGGTISLLVAAFSFASSEAGQRALYMAQMGMQTTLPGGQILWNMINRGILLLAFILTWKPFTDLLKTAYRSMNIEFGSLGATGFLIVIGALTKVSDLALEALVYIVHAMRPSTAESIETVSVVVNLCTGLALFIIAVVSVNRLWDAARR